MSKHLENFELFAFDYPGHGRSDHVSWPWNYGHSEQLKIIHEIKHKLKWSEMSIVAHSWAGNSLTPYVCMYPDQVTHYIMLDAYGKRIFEYFGLFLRFRGEHSLIACCSVSSSALELGTCNK